MTTTIRHHLISGVALASLLAASAAMAQDAAAPAETTAVEEIVVVGSQIKGAKVNAALPVTVLDDSQIAATGAVSGD
ncbi:MAG: TonB-dependent receptor, partial [Caulobacter sp.]|nr:TonB-dependent receptor [Caulobacter sp.]